MNKKLIASMLLLSFCFASTVTACSNTTIEETTTSSAVASTEETTETSEEAEETEEIVMVYDYIHGDEGYYNIFEEGYGTDVKLQTGGTCWVTAAASSMETSFLRSTGETIEIDPLDLLHAVFNEEKPEGWFAPDADQLNIGGWNWEIVETLSNGWGDYILMDATMYDDVYTDVTYIQNAIRENGSVCIGINDTNGLRCLRYFGDYFTLNVPASRHPDNFDHAVTIVGWDDNFPREYFATEASQDGAWLCQNTRGEFWGDDGFYWVSYDMPLESPTVFVISDEYDHVTAYDWGNEVSFSTGDETTVANVFHDSGTLRAIGTCTADLDTTIHIEIRDVNMQNVLYEQDAFFPVNGYHSVVLDTPIDVTDYSIVITFDKRAPAEGESFDASTLEHFVATINPGESYVLIDGEWVDMSSENISELLGIDYTPNNCCIKAIY